MDRRRIILGVLFLVLGFSSQKVFGLVDEGCVGPFPPPLIHDFRYNADPLLVETKLSSDYPTSFNWNVRRWYEDWPKMQELFYYIPQNGDDRFQLSRRRINETTTMVSLSGKSLTDAPKKIHLQISVRYPCNTIDFIINAASLEHYSTGAMILPIVAKLPRPEYVVQPGEDLTVSVTTDYYKTDPLSSYGFARHLRRVGDKLEVVQRLEHRKAYKLGVKEKNVTYLNTARTGPNNTWHAVMGLNFRPWSEADSGFFVATLAANFWFSKRFESHPYKYHLGSIIRTYFDLRSHRVSSQPAVTVHNELDFLQRGQPTRFPNGTYIVPLSRASRWSQSVRCIARAGDTPTLEATVSMPNEPTKIFRNKSTIVQSKTVTSDAFGVELNSRRLYTCNARASGKEATLTFVTTWYTPVRLVSRSPSGRYLSKTAPLTVTCKGKGAANEGAMFVKFYLLNETFLFYPKKPDYIQQHRADEVATDQTRGVTVTRHEDTGQGLVTGTLRISNADVLQGKEVVQCIVGDSYSLDYHRYWFKTW